MSLNIEPTSLLRIPGNVWVFWKDLDGTYLGCNDCMANALGVPSSGHLIGKTDYDVGFLSEEADFYRKCDKEVMLTQTLKQYYDTATLQNKKRLCLVLKMPLIDEHNKTVGMVGISYNLNKTLQSSIPQVQSYIASQIRFSRREAECVHHLLRGKTAKEIARHLNLSYRTIEHYVAKLKEKFRVKSRSELVEKLVDILMD